MGFDQITRGITNIVARVPLVAEARTGVNLRALLPTPVRSEDEKKVA